MSDLLSKLNTLVCTPGQSPSKTTSGAKIHPSTVDTGSGNRLCLQCGHHLHLYTSLHLQMAQLALFKYCTECKSFVDKQHTHPIVTSWKCNHCQKTFNDQNSLLTHSLHHEPVSKQTDYTHSSDGDSQDCDKSTCPEYYESAKLPTLEEIKKEPMIGEAPLSPPEANTRVTEKAFRHKCSICEEKFVNSWLLQHHYFEQHTNALICFKCAALFNSEAELIDHVTTAHSGAANNGDDDLGGILSGIEDKSDFFKYIVASENEWLESSPNLPTGSESKVKNALLRKTTETGFDTFDTEYKCHVCDMAFSDNRFVLKHMMQVHNSLKQQTNAGKSRKLFTCYICKKQFCDKRHILTHTNFCPFVCKVCGRCFARNNSLHLHSLIHTGEKPYACKYCPWTFRRQHAMVRHVKHVHSAEATMKKKMKKSKEEAALKSADGKSPVKSPKLGAGKAVLSRRSIAKKAPLSPAGRKRQANRGVLVKPSALSAG